ncbi:MAG: Uncharacterised protein [Cellulomonadaceae bacterium TMED98]|nr:MAG: Uncharacterised protein [Cellulomonadaceae bacterium TMED98]
MNHLAIVRHGAGLIGLQLPHKMPRQRHIRELCVFSHCLLMARFPHVFHSESHEVADQSGRVKLGDHNKGDLVPPTPRCGAGLGDTLLHLLVAGRQALIHHV